MFLEGFERMTTNGYGDEELEDAVENAWFGYYTMEGIVLYHSLFLSKPGS